MKLSINNSILFLPIILGLTGFSISNAFCDDDHPCAPEIKTRCLDEGVKPGHGRILKCLNSIPDEKLSPKCIAHRKEVKAQLAEFKEVCKIDIGRCGPVDPEHNSLLDCLLSKKDKTRRAGGLDPKCKLEVEKVETLRKKDSSKDKASL